MDMSDMFKVFRKELDWAGRKLVLETGKIARQADGAVLATYGGTTVLAAVVSRSSPSPASISSRSPSTTRRRRSPPARSRAASSSARAGRREKEILTSRLIDRPIRPLFHESYRNETQVVVTDAGARHGERSRHRGDDRHVGRAHHLRRAVHGPDRAAPASATSTASTCSTRRSSRCEKSELDLVVAGTAGRRADGRVGGQGAARGRHAAAP